MSARQSAFDDFAELAAAGGPAAFPLGLARGLTRFERRLAMAMRRTTLAVVECNAQGEITHWNPSAQRIFGFEPSEALHRPLADLLVASDARDAFGRQWQAAAHREPIEGELACVAKDGRRVPAMWFFTPIEDEDGHLLGVMCMGLDLGRQQAAMTTHGRQRLHAAQRLARLGYIVWDLDAKLATLSDEACEILGYAPGTAVRREDLMGRLLPEDRSTAEAAVARAKAARQSDVEFCGRFRTNYGGVKDLRVVVLNDYDEDGRLRSSLVTVQDVTGQAATLRELAASQARLENAQALARIGDWEWDWNEQKARFSKEALRILDKPADWSPTEREFIRALPPNDAARIVDLLNDAFRKHEDTVRFELRMPVAGGTEFRDVFVHARIEYNGDGSPARSRATIQDVTELKAFQRQLHDLSYFDSLTQLPNRTLFADRFRQAASDANRHGHFVGVMMVDLDRFKQINDSLGHGVGDDLLKQSARRLTEALRDYDTVARLSGDEFAIILPELKKHTDIAVTAAKVVNAFSQPFMLDGREVVVTVSLGTSVYPQDGNGVDDLLQFADAALYHAKDKGRNNFQSYSKELTAKASERLELENELRKALERQELELYYQPKFDLATGALVGAEGLMRWNHPTRGMVPPDKFIGIAEDTGLIVPMGEWALRQACLAARDWNAGRAQPLKIAVNLSPRQFAAPGFVETVCSVVEKSGCDPHWIELEITESLLIDARANIRAMLEALAATGMTIAIDDFGTGYSALSYLTRFPVQTLKIDRSFVRDLPSDNGSAELVKAIVSLASSLRMALVAEGVETDGQASHLKGLGCHMAQGFLFARPLPRVQFEALLNAPLSTQPAAPQITAHPAAPSATAR